MIEALRALEAISPRAQGGNLAMRAELLCDRADGPALAVLSHSGGGSARTAAYGAAFLEAALLGADRLILDMRRTRHLSPEYAAMLAALSTSLVAGGSPRIQLAGLEQGTLTVVEHEVGVPGPLAIVEDVAEALAQLAAPRPDLPDAISQLLRRALHEQDLRVAVDAIAEREPATAAACQRALDHPELRFCVVRDGPQRATDGPMARLACPLGPRYMAMFAVTAPL